MHISKPWPNQGACVFWGIFPLGCGISNGLLTLTADHLLLLGEAIQGPHLTNECLGQRNKHDFIQPPGVKNLQEGETSWIYGWFLLSVWFHEWSYHISFVSVGDWDVNHWNGSEGQQTNLACKPAIFVRDVIYVISHGSKLGTSCNLLVPRDFNSLISADLIM